MKKYITREGELRGFAPAEVDGEVGSYSEIDEPGVYAVAGVASPVCVATVTPYGASEMERKGYHVEGGLVFMPFGSFVVD